MNETWRSIPRAPDLAPPCDDVAIEAVEDWLLDPAAVDAPALAHGFGIHTRRRSQLPELAFTFAQALSAKPRVYLAG